MADFRDVQDSERRRIVAENLRRERLAVLPDPAEQFFVATRRQQARRLLGATQNLPTPQSQCLEIGCGRRGWLPDLLAWGVHEKCLNGVEIDLHRLLEARSELPLATFVLADGSELPFPDDRFDLAVVSTVFTSILDDGLRRLVAADIERVVAPGGAVLWYDFAFDNPRNPNVRGIGRRELRSLFPGLEGSVRSITLAPPLARWLVPRSIGLARLFESLAFLRTHLLAVLRKPESR